MLTIAGTESLCIRAASGRINPCDAPGNRARAELKSHALPDFATDVITREFPDLAMPACVTGCKKGGCKSCLDLQQGRRPGARKRLESRACGRRLIVLPCSVVQEWIVAPFMTQAGHRAVPWNKTHVIAERKELFADGGDERGVIATRKIGATD